MRLIEIASAMAAVIAAGLWLYSAKVEVYAENQSSPRADNLVIMKDDRKYDVTGTAQEQSRWSAYAAIAAAAAALLQAAAIILPRS